MIVLLLSSSPLSAQIPIGANDLINTKKLSERVLLVRMGEEYPDQVAAVNSKRGIILIDTGISPTLSKLYRALISREFGHDEYAYVVTTHHHFDHTNGNQVFSDAEIVAHENCPEQMRSFANQVPEFVRSRRARYQRRWKIAQSLDSESALFKRLRDLVVMSDCMCNDLESGFILTTPSLTFNDRLTVHLGDMNLKLFYFGGGFHTNNDVIAVIPEERIGFTGDLFFDSEIRSVVQSSHPLEGWIYTLTAILKEVPELKYIITIHQGVMPGEALADVRNTLVEMENERTEKENGTLILEQLLSESISTDAIERFRRICVSAPERYYLWEADLTELGRRLLSESQAGKALKVFELTVKMFPDSESALYYLADGYYSKGNPAKAIDTLERALKQNPSSSYAIDRIHQLQNEKR
jgi:glyoxylase-like metal-dependent hydrolase (beta-lactamase superfamily II)